MILSAWSPHANRASSRWLHLEAGWEALWHLWTSRYLDIVHVEVDTWEHPAFDDSTRQVGSEESHVSLKMALQSHSLLWFYLLDKLYTLYYSIWYIPCTSWQVGYGRAPHKGMPKFSFQGLCGLQEIVHKDVYPIQGGSWRVHVNFPWNPVSDWMDGAFTP